MSDNVSEWQDFLGSIGSTWAYGNRSEAQALTDWNEVSDLFDETPLTAGEFRAELTKNARARSAAVDKFQRSPRGRAMLLERARHYRRIGDTEHLATTLARLEEVSA